jgi:hypothetical protein
LREVDAVGLILQEQILDRANTDAGGEVALSSQEGRLDQRFGNASQVEIGSATRDLRIERRLPV